jgi:hypothetical protein
MANQEVPQKITPVSQPELVATLIDGAKSLFNVSLSKQQVAVLMAHINLETGSSGAGWQGGGTGNTSMHNYNLGNIQWTPGSGLDYFIGGDRTKAQQGNWVPTHFKFRAYPTLADGVKDYLINIHSRGGGNVWSAVISADPASFSQALKKTNYYEEDEGKYEAAMNARLNQFNKGNSYEAALSGNFSTGAPNVEELLDQYLAALSSTNIRSLKKRAIKQLLPNDYLLKVQAEYTSATEFARILCAAIDEELYEDAAIHTNGHKVEVQTTIHGPSQLCTQAILQLANALADHFPSTVSVIVCQNKHPNFPEIDFTTAIQQYDIFHDRIKNGIGN